MCVWGRAQRQGPCLRQCQVRRSQRGWFTHRAGRRQAGPGCGLGTCWLKTPLYFTWLLGFLHSTDLPLPFSFLWSLPACLLPLLPSSTLSSPLACSLLPLPPPSLTTLHRLCSVLAAHPHDALGPLATQELGCRALISEHSLPEQLQSRPKELTRAPGLILQQNISQYFSVFHVIFFIHKQICMSSHKHVFEALCLGLVSL